MNYLGPQRPLFTTIQPKQMLTNWLVIWHFDTKKKGIKLKHLQLIPSRINPLNDFSRKPCEKQQTSEVEDLEVYISQKIW